MQGSKNNEVVKICNQYINEIIFFIDDSKKHIEELNLVTCPNLRTILYDERGLEKLTAILSQS